MKINWYLATGLIGVGLFAWTGEDPSYLCLVGNNLFVLAVYCWYLDSVK